MFASFPERNTLHRPAVAYLIINAHVYSMLPEAMHLHISSFSSSPLNALSLCALQPILKLSGTNYYNAPESSLL